MSYYINTIIHSESFKCHLVFLNSMWYLHRRIFDILTFNLKVILKNVIIFVQLYNNFFVIVCDFMLLNCNLIFAIHLSPSSTVMETCSLHFCPYACAMFNNLCIQVSIGINNYLERSCLMNIKSMEYMDLTYRSLALNKDA
ncbi:hypothetical protein RF11_05767 [Thelohanellus kitauei]|uniref:Uncharacterized protein n=1 Tax=Thelohanellus kitauei TaxID=669202 RepID=A0A0C2MG72_THEKT|nr:hypothetical protein RF11_05767 [Thelohanellus kitauei]